MESDTPAAPIAPTSQHESGSAMRSVGQLMAHQLLTRCATFTLNIMVSTSRPQRCFQEQELSCRVCEADA